MIQAKAVGADDRLVGRRRVHRVQDRRHDVGLRVPEEEEREGLDISVARRVGLPHLGRGIDAAHRHSPRRGRSGDAPLRRSFSSVAIRGAPNAPRLCSKRHRVTCDPARSATIAIAALRLQSAPWFPTSPPRSTGPLQDLERRILDRMPEIERWLRTQWQEHTVPFYASVDLRNAGFKLAPVDTNLFPGGFNNLNPSFLPLCVQAVQTAVERVCPDARGVLLVPENHTRNVFYLQNVATLEGILRQAGMRVRIGSLNPGDHAADAARPARRRHAHARADPAQRPPRRPRTTSTRAWCCSTTTCRPGPPAILDDIDQPVVPPLAGGLVQPQEVASLRGLPRASRTVRARCSASTRGSSIPYFGVCGEINFQERVGRGVPRVERRRPARRASAPSTRSTASTRSRS